MSLAELFNPVTLGLEGTTLVEASAGTGKTHAITLLVLRLVLEKGLAPSEILVMTFTEAATAELRVRIRRRLYQALEVLSGGAGAPSEDEEPDLLRICAPHAGREGRERLERAVAELDEAPITTIHGFCHRVLYDHALRTGARYGAELARDLEELDEDVIYDFWHSQVADAPDVFAELLDEPLRHLRELLRETRRHSRAQHVPEPTNAQMALDEDFLRFAEKELAERKERQGIFGFDDLLERVADALRGPGGNLVAKSLRERFKAALVDEFQDTDPVQWEICERVFVAGRLPLFLIGDPKQAIYGFRGADVFTYLAAAKSARRVTMRVNWRSDPAFLHAVNQLFCPPETFVFEAIQHPTIEPRPGAADLLVSASGEPMPALELLQLERDKPDAALPRPNAEYQCTRIVAHEIAGLLTSGATIAGRRVGPADVAVLTRSNRQCFLVQDALRELGVNSVVINDKSVWTSEEAVDLERVLGGVLDPGSASARKRALSTVLLGVDAAAIDRLDDEPEALEAWLESFQSWQALWAERGFLRMFRQLLREKGVAQRLLAHQGGERRLTNVLHLCELLDRAGLERRLGPAALLEWLAEQRRDDQNRGEHSEIRLESDTDAVRILTVHKSKGLEFPIVYCPFTWAMQPVSTSSGVPKLFHENGVALLDVDTDKERRTPNLVITKREAVAEDVRLAYVALTRAKHRCSVLWTAVNRQGISGMSFILHPDPAFLRANEIKTSRLDKLTDAELTRDLGALAAASDGAIAHRLVSWHHSAEPLPRPIGDASALAARQVERPIQSFERTESFSGLTRHAHDEAPAPDDAARDHDEELAAPLPTSAPLLFAPAPAPAITLTSFPRGPRAGNFFHEIFEHLDFTAAEPAEVLLLAREKFEAFGYAREFPEAESDRLLGEATNAVLDALDAPLDARGLRLADVPKERRFNELEFRVPVARAGARTLSPERLAEVFAAHPTPELPSSYAERVARLGFGDLRGFLKGYIDLVFCHQGLWYVVDYKTNHLGDLVSDYDAPRMQREMAASHYYLQYHLYTLAVDRFLRRVEPEYDYGTKFGGVFYLFIKGMRPAGNTGVFFEKPPAARLAALSALLEGGAT